MLSQYNLTLAELRDQLKTQLKVEKLLGEKMQISEAEYKTQFDAMKKEKVDAGQIRASHILVKTEKEAKDLLAKIAKGEDFAKLAEKYSTDTGSGAQGGDLGYFTKTDMVKPFSDAAFALKKGQVSGIVKSQYGYHIIKVTDTPSTWTLDEKRADVKDEIVSSKLNDQVGPYLEDLKKKAKIKKSL
jgi:foldase protein PrsA